ncbi:PD40 domain-containing protein, partial [bacterium]|nr:PD40 domain-containing protein [bacterium]
LAGTLLLAGCSKPSPQAGAPVSRQPRIDPDYEGITIPPNIAPLHFRILEQGLSFRAAFRFPDSPPLVIDSDDPAVKIPLKAWHDRLEETRGRSLEIEISVLKEDGSRVRFDPLRIRVAPENIDPWLVYRRIMPAHNLWGSMGIWQRNLENFDEKPVLQNRTTSGSCMNCHTFLNNRPDTLMLHVRGRIGSGMLLAENGGVRKIDLRTLFNTSPGVYPSWHPSGDKLALSVNRIIQFFHATGESREVCDLASDIVIYRTDNNILSVPPAVADPHRMETYPCWAPDGRTLYFSSAPEIFAFQRPGDRDVSAFYDRIRYDLMKVSYDPETDTWGSPDTVVSSAATGRSLLMPRVSPDGRFLLFCTADYGSFPAFMSGTDLALMDLNSGRMIQTGINSSRSDSYHSWSSGGRWFVFSSKRLDGLFARPFLCRVDEQGNPSKPFVLPQKDPGFYDRLMENFNLPELIVRPVETSWRALSRAALNRSVSRKAELDNRVKIEKSPTQEAESPWQQPLH